MKKVTTLLVVDDIETSLPSWERLGYAVKLRVPDTGAPGFAILEGTQGELMLQTQMSLSEDLPQVQARRPSFVLYAEVDHLEVSVREFPNATVLVPRRETFYGAIETWLELEGGLIVGLSQHAS